MPCWLPPPPRPESAQARVAICMTGHLRTFGRSHVHGSIREHLIGGLSRLGALVDLFAVLGTADAPVKSSRDPWRLTPVVGERAIDELALQSLHPRQVVWVKQPWLQPNHKCRLANAAARMLLERGIAQPSAWATCYGLLEHAERADQLTYDWVIRTRPDAWWYAPHPPLCSGKACPIVLHRHPCDRRNGYSDHHFELPRSAAAGVLRGMALTYQECNTTLPYTRLEDWLGGAVATTGRNLGLPSFQTKVMPLVLVRNSSTEPSARILCRCTHPEIDLCLRGAYPSEASSSGSFY